MVIKDFKKWLSKNDDGNSIFELMYRKMTLEKLADASKSQHLMNMHRVMAACPEFDYKNLKESDIEHIQLSLIERFPHPVSLNMHILTFRKWLKMSGQGDLLPFITKVAGKSKAKLPEDMITDAELEAMIKASSHPRDAAIIALFSDSGCRVGELIKMRVKHCEFDEYGAIVTFPDGKTGPRKNRVIFAASYLRVWLNAHEYSDNPEAPLFYSMRGRYLDPSLKKTDRCMPSNRLPTPLVEDAVRMQVKMIAKKAGITRRIHPHLFRHTKATELAPLMPESLMNKVFGWSDRSQTARTYTHNTFKDVENIILREAGMKKDDDAPSIKAPPKCSRCNEINSPHAEFCFKCGLPLSSEALAKIEADRQSDAQDKEDLRAALESFKKEKAELEALKDEIRAMTYRTNEAGNIEAITGLDAWSEASYLKKQLAEKYQGEELDLQWNISAKTALEERVSLEAVKKQVLDGKKKGRS